jgi:S1-C subfamily serine protease
MRRRLIWVAGLLGVVALFGLLSRLAATGSLAGRTMVQREFETNCIEGCQSVGAPHASCRSVCACLVQDLASGRTPEELDGIIRGLPPGGGGGSPGSDAVDASRQRCVARQLEQASATSKQPRSPVAAYLDTVVVIAVRDGQGSGVVIDENGLIATNEHVVEGNAAVEVPRRDLHHRARDQRRPQA